MLGQIRGACRQATLFTLGTDHRVVPSLEEISRFTNYPKSLIRAALSEALVITLKFSDMTSAPGPSFPLGRLASPALGIRAPNGQP